MPLPKTGPQTQDGQGMATAMGGTRSNGNQPQPSMPLQPGSPGVPWMPNGGIQFTPRPAAQPPQQAPHPMAAMGGALQAQPPMVGANTSATQVNSAPQVQAANRYSYNALTGQKGGEDHNNQEEYQQGQIQRAQGNLAGAVAGYGDQERQKFQQQVGQFLGEQNSIGGLRSGGVEQGLANFGDQYGREIGDYAAMTAGQGQQQGLDANQQISDITMANQARKDAKHKSLLGGIGSILGAGAGALIGGPGGAKIGAGLGGSIG